MIVLKQGKLPEPEKWFLAGKIVICNHCGSEIELEQEDKDKVRWSQSRNLLNKGVKVSMECPVCKLNIDKTI